MAAAGIAPDPASLQARLGRPWSATCWPRRRSTIPESGFAHKGGKRGIHTEHLGHILAEMQFLQRAYPGASW